MDTHLTPEDARKLVEHALHAYASQLLARAHHSSSEVAAELREDAAAATVLARDVPGWTHTTRLREFLDKPSARAAIAAMSEIQTAAGGAR